MSLRDLHLAIWYLSPALQTILLGVLTYRRLYRVYPFFYLYTASHIARSLASYIIGRFSSSSDAYVYFYRITEAYFVIVCLMVMQEIYRAAFSELPRLRKFFLSIFKYSTVIFVVLGLISGYLAPGTDQQRGLAALIVLQRSASLLVGGLSFALLVGFRVIGLSWQTRPAGIAMGFAVNCAITLCAALARSMSSDALSHGIYAVSLAAAYALALLIWNVSIIYLIPEVHVQVTDRSTHAVSTWRRWLEGVVR